ncbi:transposase [Desulforhopalus sp. IMCC35007]|uniref:transposase n=1 Tax=Desulforhopalus sp. IMCC35007 TaxID=2569543 RepID=UPI0010AE6C51|nr:transposase [Desulforhopalus sp. IMCC35007]TKB08337.1 transposase [Desulforhopalus sp. IMCC35007]
MAPLESIRYGNIFETDQECINYLFNKRWPAGFHCPFCDRKQTDVAPAHTIVCRFCRKQSSITANTLMHGSKKSLAEWLQVAALFSCTEGGISARSLQHIFHIATYQTAWNWLKKLRQAAAIAEAEPLTGPVYAITARRQSDDAFHKYTSQIAYLIEEPEAKQQKKRIRLSALSGENPAALADFISQAVPTGQQVIAPTSVIAEVISLHNKYTLRTNDYTNREAEALIHELHTWMHHLYRGASSAKYIQDYLNEFVFRYNTRSWSNRLEILDHLFTGIMAGLPVEQAGNPARA